MAISRMGFGKPSVASVRRRVYVLALLVVVAALTPGGAALDAGGSGFGNGGWYALSGSLVGIWPQRDGKIVVALESDYRVDLLRALRDGRADTSFGKSGFVVGLRVPCSPLCGGSQIAVQPDGAFVIAQQSTLSRRLADGRVDGGFGARGRVELGSALVTGLALAPDGSIVAGLSRLGPSAMLARYRPDGTVAASFGTGGKQAITPRAPVRVAVQPDGKIVVAGQNPPLARYLADGSPDMSFGTRGAVAVDGLRVEALALRPDGRIVVAGMRDGVTEVAQFLPDGRLDPRFGIDGITGREFRYGVPRGVAALADGSVVVVGAISLGSAYKGSRWLAALVTPADGWRSLEAPPCTVEVAEPGDVYEQGDAVAVQVDGKVLLGGFSCEGTVIGRYTSSLALDAGPRLRLVALSDRGRLLRKFVSRGVLHLLGSVQASDPASITLSVERAKRARPCNGGAIRLLAGSGLGTTRVVKPAWLVRSSMRGRARTPFHVALSLARLREGSTYSVRLQASDARQRTDQARVVFTIAMTRSAKGASLVSIRAHLQVCAP